MSPFNVWPHLSFPPVLAYSLIVHWLLAITAFSQGLDQNPQIFPVLFSLYGMLTLLSISVWHISDFLLQKTPSFPEVFPRNTHNIFHNLIGNLSTLTLLCQRDSSIYPSIYSIIIREHCLCARNFSKFSTHSDERRMPYFHVAHNLTGQTDVNLIVLKSMGRNHTLWKKRSESLKRMDNVFLELMQAGQKGRVRRE